MYAEKGGEAKSPRGHQNTLESLPQVIVGLVVAGLRYPTVAAALGGLWCFDCIYTRWGTARASLAKPLHGSPFMIPATLSLQGLATGRRCNWSAKRCRKGPLL